jgi:hypothetical protein
LTVSSFVIAAVADQGMVAGAVGGSQEGFSPRRHHS